jgi:hypothetical protein
VDGKILAVNDNLVEISVGSDAGLMVGHTLDVFRLTPKSKYIGMIRIVRVEKTKAVGQLLGKATASLQLGDEVASKLIRDK